MSFLSFYLSPAIYGHRWSCLDYENVYIQHYIPCILLPFLFSLPVCFFPHHCFPRWQYVFHVRLLYGCKEFSFFTNLFLYNIVQHYIIRIRCYTFIIYLLFIFFTVLYLADHCRWS
ncbi:pA118R [African swine fever virus]|uniref:PA118R n=1 Tax=African swine fever virus TaxID=10497 RepID=A0A8A1V7P3_ASF|nr:pA118R [African swine fever virus]